MSYSSRMKTQDTRVTRSYRMSHSRRELLMTHELLMTCELLMWKESLKTPELLILNAHKTFNLEVNHIITICIINHFTMVCAGKKKHAAY